MAKSLVIVESPAKAKTINKYLGSSFTVKASMGHVMDLPKKKLGVDVKNHFKPTYEPIPGKKETIKALQDAAGKADDVYLAADPDREGEAICAHLRELLDSRKRKFYRVLFNEITREAVREAFDHPAEIDSRLVDAQQARRVLDRLVGYQVSPLLWDKVKRGISAGRVQTVALRLIVEREREIQAFVPVESWTIHALLEASHPPAFEAKLVKFKGEDIEIPNETEALRVSGEVERAAWSVTSLTRRDRRRHALPPFITSTLQQEAGNKLGFTAKKTMTLAQRLYEGVELGEEGPVALITYMRTDSVRVAPAALAQVRGFIPARFGADHLPEMPNAYKSKKGAQDAHEAIRPTEVSRTPEKLAAYLDKDSIRLYGLIWRRFVASQMVPAVYDQKTIEAAAGDYLFRSTSSVLKFDGWLAAFPEARNAKEEEEGAVLPEVTEGEALRLQKLRREQHFTEPPPRYTEASLVKTLEEKGIGRPSTYATILSVIQNRAYVEKDKRIFHPTQLGMVVSDLLVKSFSDIFDVAYTARMEEELDEVEEGKLGWTDALDEFYKKFKKDLRLAEKEMEDLKGEGRPSDEKCEKCGKPMVIRLGRNGQFFACTGYPDCDGTKDMSPELAAKYGIAAPSSPPMPDVGEQTCEKCGKPMAVKRGRFGYFLACTGYPDCRNTKRILVKDGKATVAPPPPEVPEQTCEKCGKPMAVKSGRFGYFLACTGYPDCKNTRRIIMKDGRATVAPPPPEVPEQTCEKCGKPMAVKSGRFGYFLACTGYPKCRNRKKLELEGQPAAVTK